VLPLFFAGASYKPSWIASYDAIRFYVSCHDGTCANDGATSDLPASRQDDCAGAYPHVLTDLFGESGWLASWIETVIVGRDVDELRDQRSRSDGEPAGVVQRHRIVNLYVVSNYEPSGAKLSSHCDRFADHDVVADL
jgi:hypothetical protein